MQVFVAILEMLPDLLATILVLAAAYWGYMLLAQWVNRGK